MLTSTPTISTLLPLTLLLLAPSTTAATCRNMTVTRFNQDTPYSFSNTNLTPLERINCTPSVAKNGTCSIPRGTYNIVVHRTLNITVTPEEEDSIFELAREAFINRTAAVDGIATNASVGDSQEWVERERRVDTTSVTDNSPIFFKTDVGLNYTLFFLAFTRSGLGTLGGCDNETLNGMGVRFEAPYQAVNVKNSNVTEVLGTLYGSGTNVTSANGAGRMVDGGIGLMGAMVLGSVLVMFL